MVIDEFALIPHFLHGGNKLHGVDVKDILGLGVITELLVVARQAKHILDAQT